MVAQFGKTAVPAEVVKTLVRRGEGSAVYSWRTSYGAEADCVVSVDGTLVPIEVKPSTTPRPAMADGIKAFREALGERVAPGYVVHPGDVRLPLAPGVEALPFAAL